jgi:hypothetical protein
VRVAHQRVDRLGAAASAFEGEQGVDDGVEAVVGLGGEDLEELGLGGAEAAALRV